MTRTLDIREIQPKLKHPTIFKTFDNLSVGESFVLVNDHDPKPLFYEFSAERPEEFDWKYIEQGPDTWRVEIGKKGSVKTKGKNGGCCGCGC